MTIGVFDGHNDLPWRLREHCAYDLSAVDLVHGEPSVHTDLPRLRAGGVVAQFWSVFVPCSLSGDAAVTATLEQVEFARRLVAALPDDLVLCRTADEVERATAGGRIASLMGMEGGHSINGSLGTLRMMHELGVRYLHVSADVMRDALTVTSAPVIFSHSSARAMCFEALDPVLEGWRDVAPPPPEVSDVADHFDHVREVAGIEHIGIGGDYDGVGFLPAGLEDVSGYPRLFDELRRRGYCENDLAKIGSGNILRIMRETESAAW